MSEIFPDFIQNFVIDPMHLLSGVGKLLFTIWMLPENKNHSSSLSEHYNSIRHRICSITPPSFVPRLPRKIDDFAYWKASEIILWLLVYSILVLTGKMNEEYLAHHKLLVHGIYLLYQKSVSRNDITNARHLLHQYVSDFERLYGSKFMTCNVHSLLHLSDLVLQFGPSWVLTCFPFENANGILKMLVHATRNAQIQICKGVSLYLMLDGLKKKYIREDSVSALFSSKLERKDTHRRKLQFVSDGIAIVGCAKKITLIPNYIQEMLRAFGNIHTSIYSFQCAMKDGVFYSSNSYTRKIKTNSSCVAYTIDDQISIGFVEVFLRSSNCQCAKGYYNLCAETSETLAVVQKLKHYNPFLTNNLPIKFIHLLDFDNNERSIVNISQLKAVYFCISIEETGHMYAVEPFCMQNF